MTMFITQKQGKRIAFRNAASIIDGFKIARESLFKHQGEKHDRYKVKSSCNLCTVRQIYDLFPVLWLIAGRLFDASS